MKFAHLLQSYEGQIEDLLDCEARFGKEHPHSLWAKAGAEETLASYYMANDDDRFRDHLHTALLSKIGWWKSGAGEFGAWDFILYTSVSLALKDTDSLAELLELEVHTDGYVPVTVEWFKLQRAVLLQKSYTPRKSKRSKGEEGVFEALSDLVKGYEPNWSYFDSYWRSTRNRGHQYTFLQHRNILKDGLMCFWDLKSLESAEST